MYRVFLYAVVALAILACLSIIIRFLGFSFKAKKYGINMKGTVVGYYSYFDLRNLFWYPVIKVNYNNEEVIIKTNCLMIFPIFKINEEVNVKYYNNGYHNNVNETIYTNRLALNKESMPIDINSKLNIIGFKQNIDIIIELLLFIILVIIKLNL